MIIGLDAWLSTGDNACRNVPMVDVENEKLQIGVILQLVHQQFSAKNMEKEKAGSNSRPRTRCKKRDHTLLYECIWSVDTNLLSHFPFLARVQLFRVHD
jgi:hypothetical protein